MATNTDAVVPRIVDGLRTIASRFRPRPITPTTPPETVVDDEGREVRLRAYADDADDFAALVEMYDTFDGSQRAQGTPPRTTEGIRAWLDDILGGPNVVAVHEGRVVGHVSFVPDGTGRHELAIFVHQSFQRAGIGSRLLGAGLGHAREAGVGYVWLSVEKGKRHLQPFYGRAGFSTVNPMGMTSRMSRTL
ncbi:GNAT family N-acetyltransferase [Halolamina litorea]|uniref:GNAT family N-acetyltransferase n=1 Tax=Halolamina litorea TaxID=1515593 RepID=A0ABD6BTU9_9EURY|nr:GNAT family N-acetyltransferase [Halolamina litorea]